METLSPNIFVNDMSETIAFYKILGFNLVMTVPEEGSEFIWTMMVNGSVTFMFQTFASLGDDLPQISRQNGGSLLLYINVKNIWSFLSR